MRFIASPPNLEVRLLFGKESSENIDRGHTGAARAEKETGVKRERLFSSITEAGGLPGSPPDTTD